jgi:hypothetical protein
VRRVAIVFAALVAPAACSVFGTKDDSSPAVASDAGADAFAGPAALVAKSPHASSIALDADTVYWTDAVEGIVHAASKAGGDPRVVSGGTDQPDAIAVDADNVYWLEPRVGCPSHNHVLEHPKNQTGGATALWPSDSSCYGTQQMSFASKAGFFYVQQDGTIYTLSKNAMRTPIVMGEMGIGTLVGDGDGLYWAAQGSIRTAPSSGGASTFADNVMSPGALAIDLDAVYVADGTGAILRFDRTNGKAFPVKLATGEMGVQRFALDDANLYWTSAMDHAVKSVEKKKGGTVTVLASSQDGPFAIAVDASGVYWSNTGDGTVNALRR